MNFKLTHLLMPKSFRVWCRPRKSPGDFKLTIYPSKANCSSCLTAYRRKTSGRRSAFRVSHTMNRPLPGEELESWED